MQAWLGRHPRITFHFTPISASWMNQVETWFGILTRQAIRRGSFRSVKELVAMVNAFTTEWNEGSGPFTWVKTADEILAKAVRKPRTTSEAGLGLGRSGAPPKPPPTETPGHPTVGHIFMRLESPFPATLEGPGQCTFSNGADGKAGEVRLVLVRLAPPEGKPTPVDTWPASMSAALNWSCD